MGCVVFQSPVGCASMQEGMGFTPPTLMESKVRTALVLQTLPYNLSLTEIGCCLAWAVMTLLQLHASKGKTPSLPGKPPSLLEQSKTLIMLSIYREFC